MAGSWEVRQAGGGLHLAGGEAGCPHRGAFAGPAPGRGVGCVTGHAVTRRHDPRTKVAATKTNTPTLSAAMNGDWWNTALLGRGLTQILTVYPCLSCYW